MALWLYPEVDVGDHARCRYGYDTLTPMVRCYADVDVLVQNPGDDGLIRRASRISNTIPGISRFSQGVLLAQHRIEKVFLESLAKYSSVEIQRNVEPKSITYNPSGAEDPGAYPVTVRIAQVGTETWSSPAAKPTNNGSVKISGQSKKRKLDCIHEELATEETITAKYVISCDGAHSWTRSQLGFQMEGEQSEYIWGVLGKFSRCFDGLESPGTKADHSRFFRCHSANKFPYACFLVAELHDLHANMISRHSDTMRNTQRQRRFHHADSPRRSPRQNLLSTQRSQAGK